MSQITFPRRSAPSLLFPSVLSLDAARLCNCKLKLPVQRQGWLWKGGPGKAKGHRRKDVPSPGLGIHTSQGLMVCFRCESPTFKPSGVRLIFSSPRPHTGSARAHKHPGPLQGQEPIMVGRSLQAGWCPGREYRGSVSGLEHGSKGRAIKAERTSGRKACLSCLRSA